MSREAMARLARRAASLYPPGDRFARHFAAGKLNGDPVFRHLLVKGYIRPGDRVLDLGCGQGLLAALLAASEAAASEGCWPDEWAAPPSRNAFHGIDIAARDIERARAACPQGTFQHADLRHAGLAPADVVLLLDVIHYIEPAAQEAVLQRVRETLAPHGGTLLMRVADANGSWRFCCTEALDRLAMRLRGARVGRLHSRPLAQWRRLLAGMGFEVEAAPMSEGTPFANVLLVAR